MNEKRIDIPKMEGVFCFGCGTENPIGLNLYFYASGDYVCADFTPGKNHEGWENMVHGGILFTLLDEVMSWTILYLERVFFVTRKMEIKYVKPVMVGTPLTVRGSVRDTSKRPMIKVSGEVIDQAGKILTKGIAEFIELPEEKLSSISKESKEEMKALLEKYKTV
jgi:uncharacterized protein (TIGR00369 family)